MVIVTTGMGVCTGLTSWARVGGKIYRVRLERTRRNAMLGRLIAVGAFSRDFTGVNVMVGRIVVLGELGI